MLQFERLLNPAWCIKQFALLSRLTAFAKKQKLKHADEESTVAAA